MLVPKVQNATSEKNVKPASWAQICSNVKLAAVVPSAACMAVRSGVRKISAARATAPVSPPTRPVTRPCKV